MNTTSDITIVGAGLTGSLLAKMLGERGHEIYVYEKRKDIRTTKISGGKSINLALSHRGLKSLEKTNLRQKINEMMIPMRGRKIHDIDGITSFQPYGKDDSEVINSVSRENLNRILIEEADRLDNVKFYFEHKCIDYDSRSDTLIMKDPKGYRYTLDPEVIIAADGAFSQVRTSILRADRINYSQYFIDYGYKELEIPASHNDEFLIEPNALHIWPRENFMLIALPNKDKSFTCTLFAPFDLFDRLMTEEDVKAFFKKNFGDVDNLMPTLVDDFFSNPTGKLVTIKTNPWYLKDKILMIGDASHAIVPFYGQGMNAGFEDVRILLEMMEEEDSWQKLFKKFSKTRKPNTDAIAELSFDNFVEMRDSVASEKFLMMKKAELMMYEKFDDIISKYAMVTFHPEIPYAIAKQKGEILENTIRQEFKSISDIDEFDPFKTRQKVLALYEEIDQQKKV